MVGLIFYVLGFIAGIVSLMLSPANHSFHSICNTLLLYQLAINLGLSGISGFIGHVFLSKRLSKSKGWVSSPFQTIIGYAELGFGIAGIMSFWFRDSFFLAIIVSTLPFYLGASFTHLEEMIKLKKFTLDYYMSILSFFLVPVTLLTLWFL